MHEFDSHKIERFVNKVLSRSLFHNVGETIEDPSVVPVSTIAQFSKYIQAPNYGTVGTEASNFRAYLVRLKFGADWFRTNWNSNVRTVRRMLADLNATACVRHAMKACGLPHHLDHGFDLVDVVVGDIATIALDRAYGLQKRQSFALQMLEPWLLKGHFPCGWKGRLPALPKAKVGHSPYEGLRLEIVIGDGMLRVY